MTKEDIIKIIEVLDETLKVNEEKGTAYIPTTKMLIDLRNWWIDVLFREYGVFYD